MKFRLFATTMVVAFCALAQTATQSSEAHERKLTDIRKLMSLTGGDKMANQMLDQMGASLRAGEISFIGTPLLEASANSIAIPSERYRETAS